MAAKVKAKETHALTKMKLNQAPKSKTNLETVLKVTGRAMVSI